MSMAVDNRQQSLLAGLPYEPRYQAPQFTNPWTSGAAPGQLYAASLSPAAGSLNAAAQQPAQPMRPLNLHYSATPVSSAPLGSGSVIPPAGNLEQSSLLGSMQDPSRPYGGQYAATATSNTYAPTTSAAFSMDYGNRTAGYGFSDPARRPSHPSVPADPFLGLSGGSSKVSSYINYGDRLNNEASRAEFNEALEASRGMVSMSQSDITPRNIYGDAGNRNSVGSYGFPSTHSSHSSISSASYAPSYYQGSVGGDSSVTDYSSASESVDLNSRTLPRPSELLGAGLPPAPQSMMGQFSSKVASSSQKKHKCKICDKRFTRPSSLQTHMYSHTGEKPFACEVEGCGRHFSVVSNLRRHRKVHENRSDHDDHPSPDD